MLDPTLIKPDFIVVGAMKCGTSTLAKQIGMQDGAFMTTPKEPNFFSDDATYKKGDAWYSALFDDADPKGLKGEASTHYTKLPTYPHTLDRMTSYLDHVRIIYMIRNPVVRAQSHYIHERSQGKMGRDAKLAFEGAPEIIEYGCYGAQIRPYVDAFGAQNVMLTSLEQIKADPDQAFAEVRDFLHLPDTSCWNHAVEPQNVSKDRLRKIPLQGLLIDNPIAKALRRALVPQSVRTWIKGTRKMTDRPDIPNDLRTLMEKRFLQDRTDLAQMFPNHPALTLCYPFAAK